MVPWPVIWYHQGKKSESSVERTLAFELSAVDDALIFPNEISIPKGSITVSFDQD